MSCADRKPDYMDLWLETMTRLPSGLRELRFLIYPIQFGFYETHDGQTSLETLRKIIERAVRSCPDAKVSIASTCSEPLPLQCQQFADVVLQDVSRQE